MSTTTIDHYTGELVPLKLRTAYNYNMDHVSRETALYCDDGTKTQQQFRDECDINTIVKNFGLTGELPNIQSMPQNGDFTNAVDYQTALNMIHEANEAFMQLPAEHRTRFDNDPGKFVDFASNPDNLEECRKLGLARPKIEAQAPIEVRVMADPAAPPPTP